MKEIDLYWFSGTGNTKIVVDKFAETCKNRGVNVNLFNLEKSNPKDVDLSNTIGIAFPVAAQGTYPFVWDFVKNLPNTKGTEIFMFDTMGAFSGGIVGPIKNIVEKKGYSPIGAIEIVMPSNFFVKKIDETKNRIRVEKGLKKIEQFAIDLLQKRSKWTRVPILSDLLSIVSQSKNPWELMRRVYKFEIDKDSCTKCGTCIKLCPINNISWGEDGFPKYDNRCQICMRCFSFCPTDAIVIKNKKRKKYRAVTVNKLM